jgi:hypothetical protein
VKPGPSNSPITLHGFRRDTYNRRSFLHAEAAKKAEFHNTALSRIDFCKPLECRIQGDNVRRFIICGHHGVLKWNTHPVTAPFPSSVAARVVNKNPAHHLGRNAQKMCPVLPVHSTLLDQTQVRFMNQGGGLQSMVWTLIAHVTASQPTELLVDDWDESASGLLISAPDGLQKLGHLSGGMLHSGELNYNPDLFRWQTPSPHNSVTPSLLDPGRPACWPRLACLADDQRLVSGIGSRGRSATSRDDLRLAAIKAAKWLLTGKSSISADGSHDPFNRLTSRYGRKGGTKNENFGGFAIGIHDNPGFICRPGG